jgi:hypothetical protein
MGFTFSIKFTLSFYKKLLPAYLKMLLKNPQSRSPGQTTHQDGSGRQHRRATEQENTQRPRVGFSPLDRDENKHSGKTEAT